MSTKLCALYLRVSTERQSLVRDGSLDTQESRLKGYIDFRKGGETDWKVVDTYREEGKSGKNTDRPELHRLLNDIKIGRVNTVIVTKIDRITRSLLDFYRLMDLFDKNNAEFVSLEENFDTSTPMGKAMLKITLVFAELEREQTSKRTKDKMAWRAEQGLWNGGQVLGYNLDKKKLEVNKEEKVLVELLFTKYLELKSLKAVADYVNSRGYRTKQYLSNRKGSSRGGQKFFVTNVKQKLTNPLYIGRITHKEKEFKGQHQPLIDTKLWNSVQKLLSLNSPKRRRRKEKVHEFLLQGLMKCGWCDSYMTPKYSTGRNGIHSYYQCTRNSRYGNTDCKMKYVPAKELERLVVKKLKDLSDDKTLIKDIIEKSNKDSSSVLNNLNKEKMSQENKLKPLKEKIDNLIEALSSGLKDIPSVSKKLVEYEEQKAEIERDIERISFEIDKVKMQVMNAKVMHESLQKFRQIADVASPEEIKDLIPRFIEKIIWKPEEIKIALFEQEVQRGLLAPSATTGKSGALDVSEWLPREGSNLGHCGYDLTSVT
ncbi:MAG: recombinase family protein [Candidatus Omnitrophota bacterium]